MRMYRGTCIRNNDPEGMGRIQVSVPQVSGEQALSDWALPCVPPGWFDTPMLTSTSVGDHGSHTHNLLRQVPRPGDGVWVAFEDEERTKPVWLGVWKRKV